MSESIVMRQVPVAEDPRRIGKMVAETGFFRPDEVDVAVELIEERLAKGEDSGYHFWFMENQADLAGYVCFGPTPCTVGSFDLYWIVVAKSSQGLGLGGRLTRLAEETAKEMRGRKMYVETSGKDLYAPTRGFYEKMGYKEAAVLRDFYDTGDDKIIYAKDL